jgi:hypothetical protein
VSSDLTDQQFAMVAPVMTPELLKIVNSDQHLIQTRSSAINIFHQLIEMSHTVKDEHPEVIDAFLKPNVDQWTATFLGILQSSTFGSGSPDFSLRLEVIKALTALLQGFPRLVKDNLAAYVEAVWKDLLACRDRYMQTAVVGDDSDTPDVVNGDGEVVGLENLLYTEFEFLATVARKKSGKQFFAGSSSDFVRDISWALLSYMQITDNQVEDWLEDANQFVHDEEEDTFSFNVRIAAVDLFNALVEHYPDQMIGVLGPVVAGQLETSKAMKEQGNVHWWKVEEAILLALGKVSSVVVAHAKDPKATSRFDVATLFDGVILQHMQHNELPFLQGRALVFASEYASVLPENVAVQYVQATVEAIKEDKMLPVRMMALRTIFKQVAVCQSDSE